MFGLPDIFSTSSQQRVVILDNDTLSELFNSVSPMRLSVKEAKRATKYAVEDGTERSDHIVTELTEIQLDIVIVEDIRNAFENLKQSYLENRLVTVQTRVTTYPDMLIVDFPHDEVVELGDAISASIRLQEWKAVQPEYGEMPEYKVESPKQSDTTGRGQQTTEEVSESKKSSVLYDLLGW